MMERYYRFAGVELAISMTERDDSAFEGPLGRFQVDSVEDPHRFEVSFVPELPQPRGVLTALEPHFRVYREGDAWVRYIGDVKNHWSGAHIRALHRGKAHEILLHTGLHGAASGRKSILTALAAEHLVAEAGGYILHCAYIRRGDRGILFTAPSGTGKSTQAELWNRLRGSPIINGDRAAVRFEEDRAYACGIPFSRSSAYCENCTLPLGAVVYLRQAPVTSLRRLSGTEAFARIWEGCSVNTWDPEDVARVSGAVTQTAVSVPVYELCCTPDGSAVTALEMAMKEENGL